MLDVFLRRYPFSSDYFLFDDPNEDEEEDKKDPPKGGGEDPADKGGDIDWKAEAEKYKSLSRKHEEAAKKGKDALEKLKAIEDSGKSELTKAQEELTKHQTDLAAANLELARARVALRKGLTEAQAKRLVGTNEEELESDADELIKDLGLGNKSDAGNQQRRTPRENLRSGTNPRGEPDEEMDPRKLAANVRR